LEKDTSKKAILVLAILAIIVSLFGTWVVADYVTKAAPAENNQNKNMQVAEGHVSLEIKEPPKPASAEAEVSLNIQS